MSKRLIGTDAVTFEVRRYGVRATDGSENVIRYLYVSVDGSETCVGRLDESYTTDGDAERVEKVLRASMVRDLTGEGR